MALLKRANVEVTDTASTKAAVPTFTMEGTAISRFNELDAKIKDLEAEKKEIRAKIEHFGLTKLFAHNLEAARKGFVRRNLASSEEVSSSVKLQDEKGDLRVTLQDRYKSANPDVASAMFESLGADVNDYVHETVNAKFSDTAFLDASGSFNDRIFAEFQSAIDEVARRHNKTDVLVCARSVQPKPGFHDARWANPNLATVNKQFAIQQALPATVVVSAGKSF